jgi:hypothetical protein
MPFTPYKIRVYDFKRCATGTIVTRSPHWMTEHPSGDAGQLGVIVDREFYADAKGQVICWPSIHWEGQAMDSLTHPANAVPYRQCEPVESSLWLDMFE